MCLWIAIFDLTHYETMIALKIVLLRTHLYNNPQWCYWQKTGGMLLHDKSLFILPHTTTELAECNIYMKVARMYNIFIVCVVHV